jgi:hypothetical protein
MSMIGWALGVTPPQISALRANPSLVRNLVWVTEGDRWHRAFDDLIERAPPERRAQLEQSYASFAQSPASKELAARVAKARPEIASLGTIEKPLNLEKSWHLLHYLMTGDVSPVGSPGDLLLTGEDIGEDLGYGPARLHSESATQAFSRFLDAQDGAHLQAGVDLKDMSDARVYGVPMGPGPAAEYETELRNEVAIYFPRLRDYVRTMADRGNALLVWVS